MFYFGDDSSCSSGGTKLQDVFLFGGFYVDRKLSKSLEKRIAEIKVKFGSTADLPLKWNFKDLYPTYYAAGKAALLKALLAKSDEIRLEMVRLLDEFHATVLIAGIRGHSLQDLKTRREYHAWALTMILQRLGFVCGREDSSDVLRIQVTLDWPGGDIQKSHFAVFHKAYHDGLSHDGMQFKSGPLRAKGFSPALEYSSTEHNPLLQLADMMLGVCADFVKWSFTGRGVARLREMFPIVFRRLRSATPYYDEFTTGFVIAPHEFRRHIRQKYVDFQKQSRQP
jgi:hypothetical protein